MVLFGNIARATALLLPCCWTTGIAAADSNFLLLAGPAPNGWQTESDVRTEASIVDDMIEMYEGNSMADRLNWYEQGHGLDGEITLKSLGANAGNYSTHDPLFNYYTSTFSLLGSMVEDEANGIFDSYPVNQYAHAIVNDLFDDREGDTNSDGVETEAILVTGLWMRVYHYLYENLRLCAGTVDTRMMLRNVDRAAAFWIGDKQTYGSNTVGVLLYNLAERTSLLFGQDEGEANVNTEFLATLTEMRVTIESEECSAELGTDSVGYEKMHQYVTDAVRQMNILLVQRLIHFLSTDSSKKFTKLYVLSLIPQIQSCSASDYEYFLNNVILTKPYATESVTMAHLQKMYSCLGVTCEDIGSYSGDRVPQCDGAKVEPLIPLASYLPISDVHLHSKMDRDIRQMKILLANGNQAAAKDMYKRGRNMVNRDFISGYSTPNTLQHFASGMDTFTFSDDPSRLPIMFENYYDGDADYANILVLDAFDTPGMDKVEVPYLLQTIVAPHFAIKSFFEAVDVCESYGERAVAVFDQGVAVLVGSNEGQTEGGSEDGVSWFALAKEFCTEFECDDPQNPVVNREMLEMFNSSKEYIRIGNCDGLLQNVRRIESLILIPIIQGLLYHSDMWRHYPTMGMHHASVQVFAKAVLPLIKLVSKVQAHIIQEVISTPFGEVVDSMKLWTAIGNVLDDGSSRVDIGITCNEIGTSMQLQESFCDFVDKINNTPTVAPVRLSDQTNSPTTTVTMSPTSADRERSINMSLINERYTFTDISKAEQKALIALDVRDILQIERENGDSADAVTLAKLVYTEGMNTKPLSLQELGQSGFRQMTQDAFYNFYRQAWRDESIFVDYNDTGMNVVDLYADAVVSAALNLAGDLELAAEAAIALIMPMQIIHLLSVELESCLRGENEHGKLVDDAFAFYLGVKQTKGNSDGYLLYSLAQKAGLALNTLNFSMGGEAEVNIKIIFLFQQAKEQAQSCNIDYVETYDLLRKTVGSIISTMNIPMVQFMEHYLLQIQDNVPGTNAKPENYVELYALAILPQVRVCNPTAYDGLADYIIGGTVVANEVERVLVLMRNNYDCLGITCRDVHGNNENCPVKLTTLAGFVPEKNVNQNAMIDQDILKITALLNENALRSAYEYYTYGDPGRHRQHGSVRGLAISDLIKMSPFHQDFKQYYGGSDTYADDFITDALSLHPKNSIFKGISADIRSTIVSRTIQTMILLPAALGSMMSAVQACKEEELFDKVVKHWDTAAALLIGSIEGDQRGGDDEGNGLGMFGLAKEVCRDFSSCSTAGIATANEKLLDSLSAGENLISASSGNGIGGDCSTLEVLVTEDIIPILMVPLMQKILDAVYHNESASAFALARAILPIVNKVDSVSATTIDSETPFIGGDSDATSVANAFAGVFDGMGISCNDFGKWKKLDFDFCSFTDSNDDEGTSLSNGLYVTTTDVQEWANIDLDVKDMTEAMNNNNYPMAKDFYLNGFNSHTKDTDGKSIGIKSIGQMSLNVNMIEEPVFNLYRYALGDNKGSFLADDVLYYAHSLVMSFFDKIELSGDSSTLPAEAAVALNIWGNIVHKLYVTVERCDAKSFQGNDNGVQYIDQAVAYWIGSAQSTGDSSKGHLLYRMSEEAGEMFGQGLNGQTRNNRKILQLFTQASRLLSFSNGCKDNASGNFRAIVNKIVAQMTVPLVQHLIHNLEENDLDRIKLYGHAVVPLIAGCRKSSYNYLKEKLINSVYSSDVRDEVISELQSTFDCLSITCKDVGDYIGVDMPTCNKRQDLAAFAGYTPRTNAQEYSDIDLDIRYIEIMLRMEAYDAAKDVYMLGKHAIVENGSNVGPLSLQHLATSKERKKVPSFGLFNTYFSDENYANSAIMGVFNEPIIPGANRKSSEQKRAMIVHILRYMVTPMAALQKLYEAVDNCKIISTTISKISHKRWDEAAAILIGSMEGSKNRGSEDGYLMHGLASSLCLKFGVCGKKGNAKVNVLMKEALYAGSSSLSTQSCTNVQESVLAIENHMLVPLIQASLLQAFRNSKLEVNSGDWSISSAYVFSRAFLPYIQDQTEVSAVIEKNLNFQLDVRPVEDGWQNVFRAFETAVDNMDNIDCRDVGYLSMADAGICPDDGAISGVRPLRVSSSRGYLLVSTVLLAFNILMR